MNKGSKIWLVHQWWDFPGVKSLIAAGCVVCMCASWAAAAVTFFVHPDGRLAAADPTLDLAFQQAAGLPVYELDFHEFVSGYIFEPSPLRAGSAEVRPRLLNSLGGSAANLAVNGHRLIETYVTVPDISGIIEGDPAGGAALLNRTYAGNSADVVGAAVEFTFSEPVRGFGTWIMDDIVEPSRFVLKVTEAGGATFTSAPMDSGNGVSLAIEGFIGAVSDIGIIRAVVEQQTLAGAASDADFFYLDHVQVGGRVPAEICDNGVDDNGNGLVDCADPDCQNRIDYPGCGESLCDDGIDNDGDGLADCADSDCFGLPGCTEERSCSDGLDNDLDGVIDCSDSDCSEDEVCVEICDDGIDNDADGLVDCEDLECMPQEICPSICESLAVVEPASRCPDSLCFVEPGCEDAPDFFVRPDGRLQDADAGEDLPFREAAAQLTEFDFQEFGHGHLTDPPELFSAGGKRMRPILLNMAGDVAVDPLSNGGRLIETYPFVPSISGIIEGGSETGSALLNRTVDSSGSELTGAAVEFSFSSPVQAFGTWILEDFLEPSQYVLRLTDVNGTTFVSPPLDSHNGATLAVEGFIGAVCERGIVKAVIEQQAIGVGGVGLSSDNDFFYLDHVQVGELLCNDPFADADGDGDVDQSDFGEWQLCLEGLAGPSPGKCECFDRMGDGQLDSADFEAFRACLSGSGRLADPDCD